MPLTALLPMNCVTLPPSASPPSSVGVAAVAALCRRRVASCAGVVRAAPVPPPLRPRRARAAVAAAAAGAGSAEHATRATV